MVARLRDLKKPRAQRVAPVKLSRRDRDNLIRISYAESLPNASQEDYASIASVVKNRATMTGTTPTKQIAAPSQFSAYRTPTQRLLSGRNDRFTELEAGSPEYEYIGSIVDGVFNGTIPDPTNGADHYYAIGGMVNGQPPGWASGMTGVTQVGPHTFGQLGYVPGFRTKVPPGQVPAGTMTADQIRQAQEALGNMTAVGLEVDGVYGPNTMRAVRDFQVAMNLPSQTGVMDAATQAAIGRMSRLMELKDPQGVPIAASAWQPEALPPDERTRLPPGVQEALAQTQKMRDQPAPLPRANPTPLAPTAVRPGAAPVPRPSPVPPAAQQEFDKIIPKVSPETISAGLPSQRDRPGRLSAEYTKPAPTPKPVGEPVSAEVQQAGLPSQRDRPGRLSAENAGSAVPKEVSGILPSKTGMEGSPELAGQRPQTTPQERITEHSRPPTTPGGSGLTETGLQKAFPSKPPPPKTAAPASPPVAKPPVSASPAPKPASPPPSPPPAPVAAPPSKQTTAPASYKTGMEGSPELAGQKPQTMAELTQPKAPTAPAPGQTETVEKVQKIAPPPPVAAPPSKQTGDPNVRALQESLKKDGFDPGPIDGIMGPQTQAAQAARNATGSGDGGPSAQTRANATAAQSLLGTIAPAPTAAGTGSNSGPGSRGSTAAERQRGGLS